MPAGADQNSDSQPVYAPAFRQRNRAKDYSQRIHRRRQRGNKKRPVSVQHPHHQPAHAKNYYGREHDAQQAHRHVQLTDIGIRGQGVQTVLHDPRRENPGKNRDCDKHQENDIYYARCQTPGAAFIAAGEKTGEDRNKSRAERAARHQVEQQFGDAVGCVKRIQGSACAKSISNDHLMSHPNQAGEDESEHHNAGGARDLPAGAFRAVSQRATFGLQAGFLGGLCQHRSLRFLWGCFLYPAIHLKLRPGRQRRFSLLPRARPFLQS